MATSPAGSGYFISPTDGPGPGVLLLHSFFGLNRTTKDAANALADLGFTVLAPDLAEGAVFDESDATEAIDALAEADVNVLASLVQASVGILRNAHHDSAAPIGVVGFGSGASWALWLSARLVDEVAAVVTYYGSQSIPMDTANASYLCHWADSDSHVSDLEVAELGLSLKMANRPFTFEHYPLTSDGFAEAGSPNFDAVASALAWQRTADFLRATLR